MKKEKELWEKYFDRIKDMRDEAFSKCQEKGSFDFEALNWGLSHIEHNIRYIFEMENKAMKKERV